MARERPTASDVPQIPANPAASPRVVAEPAGDDALTHAQTRALRRCAPLSTAEFRAQRLVVAQQHRFSVQRILRRTSVRRDASQAELTTAGRGTGQDEPMRAVRISSAPHVAVKISELLAEPGHAVRALVAL